MSIATPGYNVCRLHVLYPDAKSSKLIQRNPDLKVGVPKEIDLKCGFTLNSNIDQTPKVSQNKK